MPAPKYIFEEGVMKLNPAYAQEQKDQKSTVADPSKSIAIVSSTTDIQAAGEVQKKETNTELKLAPATVASMEIMQDQDYLDKFKASKPLDGGDLLDGLTKYFEKYEVPVGLVNKLLALSEYQLNFLIDDSGSMSERSDLQLTDASQLVKDRCSKESRVNKFVSRWQEAEDRLHIFMDMLAYVPTYKIKLNFLNRDTVLELDHTGKTPEEFAKDAHSKITKLFDQMPSGVTPLKKKLTDALSESKTNTFHYVLTDGTPSDGTTDEIAALVKGRAKAQMNPINFISCTNNSDDTDWMKEVEEAAEFVSELDDFASERDEVKKDQGSAFPYSKGFWLISQLAAAINPHDLDALDEARPISKFTMDNMMGRQLTSKEYRYYLECNPNAKNFKDCFDKLETEQTNSKKIVDSVRASSGSWKFWQQQQGQAPSAEPQQQAGLSYGRK